MQILPGLRSGLAPCVARRHEKQRPTLSPPLSACAYNIRVLACDGAFGTSTQRGKNRRLEGGPACWRVKIQEARANRQ